PSCANSTDGSIDLTLTGGVGPFSFNWSNGAVTEDISSLGAGTFSVTITDQGTGCQLFDTYTLTAPLPISGSVDITPVSCNGASDGAIDITVSGGTAPYSFVWNPGNILTEDISGLDGGSYQVTVTD